MWPPQLRSPGRALLAQLAKLQWEGLVTEGSGGSLCLCAQSCDYDIPLWMEGPELVIFLSLRGPGASPALLLPALSSSGWALGLGHSSACSGLQAQGSGEFPLLTKATGVSSSWRCCWDQPLLLPAPATPCSCSGGCGGVSPSQLHPREECAPSPHPFCSLGFQPTGEKEKLFKN